MQLSKTPIAIGGVGGSGTRLIAEILNELGFYIGSDINEAKDNAWFAFLFKRPELLYISGKEFQHLFNIFLKAMGEASELSESEIKTINQLSAIDRLQNSAKWSQQRAASLISGSKINNQYHLWGWKEPNTHIVLDHLHNALPNMKYIHVIRNGLDMAYSKNQKQLMFWGDLLLGESTQISPYYSLKYWHLIHRRILTLGGPMGSRFLCLNFDQLCLNPKSNLPLLLDFLGVNVSPLQLEYLLQMIKPPKSIGRFKEHSLDTFHPKDISFVKSMGFDVVV